MMHYHMTSTISGQYGRMGKQALVFIRKQYIDLLPSQASDLALFFSPLPLQSPSKESHPAYSPKQKADAKGCGTAVFMIKGGRYRPNSLPRIWVCKHDTHQDV